MTDTDLALDGTTLARLRRNLLRWFHEHGRDLPWRKSRDPYRTWVSEIMLQQTTVAAVVPYYERFLARFPTVEALARAREHDVLRLWEGLGYYSRARNLRLAAQQIVTERNGTIPQELDDLVRLPGIGRYTAGAIASLAFDRPAPIVEANTLRVYARLLAFGGDVHSTAGRNVIWNFAERAVPQKSAGAFNQALMDLGAMICTPVAPACERCPVRSCCRAFRDGVVNEIPRPRVRPETTFVNEAMIAVREDGRYLLRRSPSGERWAGLWEFLRIGLGDDQPGSNGNGSHTKSKSSLRSLSKSIRRRLDQAVTERCGLSVESEPVAFEFHHTVTRFRIRLLCVIAESRRGSSKLPTNFRWAMPTQFGRFALSMPARKFAQRLAEG
ncbi:MAG TPA: A/G-specific adenine glycosylase [Planctomycetaceae bacterium]|nr:A/G-specific adenine glycosylase [Planctomycetaceae bacterium]